LNSLRQLQLWDTQISTIPESIGNFGNLINLSIISNFNLTSVPESICDLLSFKYFYLDNSSVSTLPECFGNLDSLEILILNHNLLTTLPESMNYMNKL